MADFFEDPNAQPPQDPNKVVEETKFTVGNAEYSQGELSRLVGLGKLAEEAETKYNTRIDKVWPDYGKTKNELKEAQEKLAAFETQRANQPAIPEDEQRRQARLAAQNLGIVTDDQFDTKLASSFQKYYVQQRAAEKLLDEAGSLEQKYTGEDGRPKFDRSEILSYMSETGIRKPELAYKEKYEHELETWQANQLRAARKPGFVTQTTSTPGAKVPAAVRPTRENLDRLVAESLHTNED